MYVDLFLIQSIPRGLKNCEVFFTSTLQISINHVNGDVSLTYLQGQSIPQNKGSARAPGSLSIYMLQKQVTNVLILNR